MKALMAMATAAILAVGCTAGAQSTQALAAPTEAYLPLLTSGIPGIGSVPPALTVDSSRYPLGATIEHNISFPNPGTYCVGIRLEGAPAAIPGSENCVTGTTFGIVYSATSIPAALISGVKDYRVSITCNGGKCDLPTTSQFLNQWTRVRW